MPVKDSNEVDQTQIMSGRNLPKASQLNQYKRQSQKQARPLPLQNKIWKNSVNLRKPPQGSSEKKGYDMKPKSAAVGASTSDAHMSQIMDVSYGIKLDSPLSPTSTPYR